MSFLDLYFERIDYSGSPKLNLQTLRERTFIGPNRRS